MDITTLTVGTVFLLGLALSAPLGWIFRVHLVSNRDTHIDGMRAIAALMVVCSHYLLHARLAVGEPGGSAFKQSLGTVGVSIFFGITGYLFTRKAMGGPIDIPALVGSRLRRIVPLYLAAMAAAVALTAYVSTSLPKPEPVEWLSILQAFEYGFFGGAMPNIGGASIAGAIGQAWTLNWEWLFYLCVPFLAAALNRATWFLGALAFAGICAFYQMQLGAQPWAFFIPGVLCGVAAGRVKPGKVAQAVALIVGVGAFWQALSTEMEPYGTMQFVLCMIGFPGLVFGHRWLLSLRPLRLLGEVSYSIYLTHLLVATGFQIITTQDYRDTFNAEADKLWLGVAMIAGMFVLSFITYALIERPFMKRAKGQSGSVALAPSSGLIDSLQ